jgi:hypothetical protein
MTPRGVGHVYAADHYLDAWIAVAEQQGWNEESLARLRGWLNTHELSTRRQRLLEQAASAKLRLDVAARTHNPPLRRIARSPEAI